MMGSIEFPNWKNQRSVLEISDALASQLSHVKTLVTNLIEKGHCS